jgi:hypothetical protein
MFNEVMVFKYIPNNSILILISFADQILKKKYNVDPRPVERLSPLL